MIADNVVLIKVIVTNRLVCLMLAFLMLAMSTRASANEDYSAGMSAYMEGDFERAQIFWVKAARDNSAKAMFNLGLLHDERKIQKADKIKADRWFKLAGLNGYGAADLYYAIRQAKSGESSDKLMELIDRAAQNGSFPAKKILLQTKAGNDISSILRSKYVISSAPNKVVSKDPSQYRNEFWIKSQASSAWTIQMLAFQDLDKVREFIDQHGLHDQAAYFSEKTSKGLLYKLVYGVYSGKQSADEARDAMSPALREHRPWLRSMASVKAVIGKQ
jgi:hypothetical protein